MIGPEKSARWMGGGDGEVRPRVVLLICFMNFFLNETKHPKKLVFCLRTEYTFEQSKSQISV
jgi:hypothetical protein